MACSFCRRACCRVAMVLSIASRTGSNSASSESRPEASSRLGTGTSIGPPNGDWLSGPPAAKDGSFSRVSNMHTPFLPIYRRNSTTTLEQGVFPQGRGPVENAGCCADFADRQRSDRVGDFGRVKDGQAALESGDE